MLRADGVWFRYDEKKPWVLRDLSMQLAPGEVLGLCGPSGGGKSTLGRVFAGFVDPVLGSVTVDGEAWVARRGAVNPVQLVLQHPERAMDPRWTIREVLNSTGAGEQVIVSLDPRHVSPVWMDRYPHEISGGELQRVNLARALLAGPRYLIADEITASLDALTQAQIWSMLVEHSGAAGIGVLAISHDRPLLEQVADRIIDWSAGSGGPVDSVEAVSLPVRPGHDG